MSIVGGPVGLSWDRPYPFKDLRRPAFEAQDVTFTRRVSKCLHAILAQRQGIEPFLVFDDVFHVRNSTGLIVIERLVNQQDTNGPAAGLWNQSCAA